jgi:hypothetical protein
MLGCPRLVLVMRVHDRICWLVGYIDCGPGYLERFE